MPSRNSVGSEKINKFINMLYLVLSVGQLGKIHKIEIDSHTLIDKQLLG